MKKNSTHTGPVSRQGGFTLIEVLIYIVLFGMLMSGAVVAAYQLIDSSGKQYMAVVAQQEGTFVNRKVSWALTPATSVAISGGGKIMTITRPDLGSESPLVVDGTGTRITLKRGSAGALPLTSDGLDLTDVLFETTPASGGLPSAVKIHFTIEGKLFTYGLYLRQ